MKPDRQLLLDILFVLEHRVPWSDTQFDPDHVIARTRAALGKDAPPRELPERLVPGDPGVALPPITPATELADVREVLTDTVRELTA